MGAVEQESIPVLTAGDAAVLRYLALQPGRHMAENLISVGSAVALIDHMEMADVHHHGIRWSFPMIGVHLFHIPVEELPVVQPRQMIALGGADDVPVLKELDGPQYPGQHHPGQRIGLGNKVRSPLGQALRLRLAVRGHHDHGNPAELGVPAQLL